MMIFDNRAFSRMVPCGNGKAVRSRAHGTRALLNASYVRRSSRERSGRGAAAGSCRIVDVG